MADSTQVSIEGSLASLPTSTAELEAQAILVMIRALEPLDKEGRIRTLRWAVDKYAPHLSAAPKAAQGERSPGASDASHNSAEKPRSFREFWNRVRPESQTEQALTSVYWHTVILGETDVDSAGVSVDLVSMGFKNENIHRTMIDLVRRKPALVIVTGKTGQGTAARRRFRVSGPGENAMEELMSRSDE